MVRARVRDRDGRRRGKRWQGLICALAVAHAAGHAHADAPITDRHYAIDFYDGVAIGDTVLVGMGGAGAAHIIGTAGALLNASTPAIRETTDNDPWTWDYHLDFLSGRYSTDYDNNGSVATGGAQLLTGGIGLRYRRWGVALTSTGQTTPIEGATQALDAQAIRLRLLVSRMFQGADLAVGLGVQTVSFQIVTTAGDKLFDINGGGLVAGATWLPRQRSFRIAGGLESEIVGGGVTASCDPSNCEGYILPERVASPWRLVAGGAYRIAASAWNHQVPEKFRDERSLTLAADGVLTGASSGAYGLEAFGAQQLQRSGRHPVVSLRVGAEYEWLPGRLRWRAGSYWEPGRFDGVGGRVHVTFGTELRVFAFSLWGPRRGRLSFTGDVAARYRNVAVSIGFWH